MACYLNTDPLYFSKESLKVNHNKCTRQDQSAFKLKRVNDQFFTTQNSCTAGWLGASLITQPGPLEGVWQLACRNRINVQCAEHGCGAASPRLNWTSSIPDHGRTNSGPGLSD